MSEGPGSKSRNWDAKAKSNEEETRKLSVAPTATLKVKQNERRVPKTITDSNFELASDLYVDKGPRHMSVSTEEEKKTVSSHYPQPSLSPTSSPPGTKKKEFPADLTPQVSHNSNSANSQFTDLSDDFSEEYDCRSPDYTFFADESIKLSRGLTAYKVIKPELYDENQPPSRTIVCLHGLMDSSYIFEDITELLTSSVDGPQAQVVVLDFYGHGRSPWNGFPCTLDIFVTQTQELLEALHVGSDGVDIIGYSLGGAVGVGFSVKFPHLCRSLILIDPAGIRLKNPARYRPLKRKFFGELTIMYRKSAMASDQLDLFFNTEFNTTHRPLIDKQMAMVTWQQKHTPGYLGAQLSVFRNFPLSGMADLYAVSGRRTERPVLFLWGNEDNLFPLRKALAVVENAFPTAEILSLMECGHNPIFEKFEDVAPAILNFYNNL